MPLTPLVGHDALRQRLLDAMHREVLPQSLLLHGAAGIGKQQLALWFARALLCSRENAPCGACQHCRYALELTHPDLLWVFPRPRLKDTDPSLDDVRADLGEAAAERVSDGGLYPPPPGTEGIYVSMIRLLVHQAAITPALARRKVFVVGDCDRMVPQEGAEQAANAFLKLLEEPPADTFLILTTSAPGALLPTIRSRVVAFRLAPLADSVVEEWATGDRVRQALDALHLPEGTGRRVRLAAGAPGRLLSSGASSAAADSARRLLEAALATDRSRALRLALGQGASGARGTFSDVLDALSIALHDRARSAVAAADHRAAFNSARAVALVEESKRMASGNVNPQLITASLLGDLGRILKE